MMAATLILVALLFSLLLLSCSCSAKGKTSQVTLCNATPIRKSMVHLFWTAVHVNMRDSFAHCCSTVGHKDLHFIQFIEFMTVA